ncbi:MAG: ATP-dependent 6-phosphofructokinase [Planctomycetes bacterium]|nr:ATP-dependent 6-phosphofructokinase [Planctomycetota bacterium]
MSGAARGDVYGVLTGGGDAPGLNAAICGLGRRLQAFGARLVGFRKGWAGVIDDDGREFEEGEFDGLVTEGGTILGCSSATPYRNADRDVPRILETFRRRGLAGLVAIGGDGTLSAAHRLHQEQALPVVGVPKTIDNDVAATDFTFGFFTAVERATTALDQLRTTAEAHDRIMVVECMGRHTGWITAYAGVAAAAEAILVPERAVELDELCNRLENMRAHGRRSAVLAVAEGARIHEGGRLLSSTERDEWGEFVTGGAAELVAERIQARLGWESRPLVLGHLQRSGPPIAFDRIFALRLGAKAARLLSEHRFGRMACLRNGDVVDVGLGDAVAERKALSEHFLDRYESFFAGAM